MFGDEGDLINQTRYTQPAMAAFAAGVTAILKGAGIKPDAAAGLSLGEYNALYAAEVFDIETLIRLLSFRGKAMEEAAAGTDCAMSAVLGLSASGVQTGWPFSFRVPPRATVSALKSRRSERILQSAVCSRC